MRKKIIRSVLSIMLCGALTTGIISSNVKVASASTKITDLKILNPIQDLIKTYFRFGVSHND